MDSIGGSDKAEDDVVLAEVDDFLLEAVLIDFGDEVVLSEDDASLLEVIFEEEVGDFSELGVLNVDAVVDNFIELNELSDVNDIEVAVTTLEALEVVELVVLVVVATSSKIAWRIGLYRASLFPIGSTMAVTAEIELIDELDELDELDVLEVFEDVFIVDELLSLSASSSTVTAAAAAAAVYYKFSDQRVS